jgi:hypothetical protein
MISVGAGRGRKATWQIGVGNAAESPADTAGRIEDGVLLGDIGPRREVRAHRRATERSGTVHQRKARGCGIDLHHKCASTLEREIAVHRHRRARRTAARSEHAARNQRVADNTGAGQDTAGVDRRQRRRRDRTVHHQRATIDVGRTGVGVGGIQDRGVGAGKGQRADIRDHALERQIAVRAVDRAAGGMHHEILIENRRRRRLERAAVKNRRRLGDREIGRDEAWTRGVDGEADEVEVDDFHQLVPGHAGEEGERRRSARHYW